MVKNHRERGPDGSSGCQGVTATSTRGSHRRTFLSAVGAAGAVALAGCSGGDEGDGGDGSDGGDGGDGGDGTTTGTTDDFETRTVKFSLDWVPKGDHAGFLVAQNRGMWADRGLSVQLTRGHGSDQTVKEVGSEQSEFGLAGLGVVMSAIEQGLDITQQCAIYNNIPSIIMAHPDAGIDEPEDLEGTKTILPSGVNTALSETLFNRLGLDWGSVDLETRGFVETSVLINGEADWVSESGPDLPAVWSQGFEPDAYNWLNEHLGVIAKGIIVKDSYHEENPEVVKRFVDGALEGWRYVLNNGMDGINEAVDSLFKFFPESALAESPEGLDGEEFHRQNAMLMNSNLLTEGTREHGLGYFPRDKVETTMEIFNENYLEEGSLSVEDVFDVDYVESGAYPIEFDDALSTIEEVGGRPNPLLSHLDGY